MTAWADLIGRARQFQFALTWDADAARGLSATVRSLRETAELAGWPPIVIRMEAAEANVDQVCDDLLGVGDLAGEVVATLEPIASAPLDRIEVGLASLFDLFQQMESSLDTGGSLLEEVRDDLVAATGKAEVAEPFQALLDRFEVLRAGLGELRDRAGDEQQALQDAHRIASGGRPSAGSIRTSVAGGSSTSAAGRRAKRVKRVEPGRKPSERASQLGRAIPVRRLPASAKLGVIQSAASWSWSELTNYLHLPASVLGAGLAMTGALGFVGSVRGWMESEDEKAKRKRGTGT